MDNKTTKKHTEEVTSGAPQTRNPGIVELQPPKRKRVYGTEVKRRKKARLQAEAANAGRSKSGPSSSGINSKGKGQATIANSKIPGGKRPQGQKKSAVFNLQTSVSTEAKNDEGAGDHL